MSVIISIYMIIIQNNVLLFGFEDILPVCYLVFQRTTRKSKTVSLSNSYLLNLILKMTGDKVVMFLHYCC